MMRVAAFVLSCTFWSCGPRGKGGPGPAPADLPDLSWDQHLARVRGSIVNFGMWAGDDIRNRYFQTTVTRTLAQRFGITLRIVPCADTVELVNKLLNERAEGK